MWHEGDIHFLFTDILRNKQTVSHFLRNKKLTVMQYSTVYILLKCLGSIWGSDKNEVELLKNHIHKTILKVDQLQCIHQ